MANHRQAAKRNRQRIKRQAHHRHFRATMRSLIKRVRSAMDKKDTPQAKETLIKAIPLIDSCAQKGVIPKKRASRMISRLTRGVSRIQSAE